MAHSAPPSFGYRGVPAQVRRRRTAVAAVLLVVLALIVYACAGGSDGPKRPVADAGRGSPSGTASHPASSRAPSGSPAAANAPRRPTGTPVTLAFAGDVHFEGDIAGRLASDPSAVLGPMAAPLASADLAMVNLETAITSEGTPASKQFTFRAPPSAFTALRDAGVDVATEANNHGEDYGQVGLIDSLAAAQAAHFPVVGIGMNDDQAFAPYRTTVKGQRIAIIGATQVLDDNLVSAWTAGPGHPGLASAKDVPRLLAAVKAARAEADTVVVFVHWGQELVNCPIDPQRTLARQLVDAGADIVVGSHAHVLLGGGWLDGAYVDYGLGNFAFYVGGGGPTAQSGVLTLTVGGRAVTAAHWTPASISDGQPEPLTGSDASAATASWNSLRSCTGLSATAPSY